MKKFLQLVALHGRVDLPLLEDELDLSTLELDMLLEKLVEKSLLRVRFDGEIEMSPKGLRKVGR